FLDHVVVLRRRGGLLQQGELAIDSLFRFARNAMHEKDEIAEVVRIDVGSLQLALEIGESGAAAERAVRFGNAEERAATFGTLFAAKLSQHVLQTERREKLERDFQRGEFRPVLRIL